MAAIKLDPKNFATPYEYETARELAELEEKVLIQLPKDNDNYKDDVVVQINGKTWLIQRGVQVAVPRKVANILAQSQHQLLLADARSNSASNVNLGER